MQTKNNKSVSAEPQKINGSDIFEIALDESEKNQYEIALPLSYNFKVTPLDGKGKSISVSSITNSGVRTIIETPGPAAQWKVIVMKPEQEVQSNMDETGKPIEEGGDENGDGFVDWLCKKASNADENTKETVQNAKRRIIFMKEGK